MDWAKVLSKTPLPTVLVVVGAILAMIAAASGLDWGNSLRLHLDLGGRIGLGLLGVVLCGAGFYTRLTGGKSSTLAALPEFTMIRLFPPDQPEDSKPWYEIGDYEFQRKLEFDADPVFDLAVENRSSHTLLLYRVGIHILRRKAETGGIMGVPRPMKVQADFTVHCPEAWKQRLDIIDECASTEFVRPIEIKRGDSAFRFTLTLRNFADPDTATASEVRFFLKTGNGTAESRSIWLHQ